MRKGQLRLTYLAVQEDVLLSEYDFARYVYKLLDSKLFAANKEYVRRQILYCLLQVCWDKVGHETG